MWRIILGILLIGYLIYGITHVVKNKSLNRVQKAVWIFIAVFMPVLGVALYLKSTFEARE